jgi:CubicO group peptidase (beta-lactamase class C family)
MFLTLLIILVVASATLYTFAPHAPSTPSQVNNVSELESYLNRLTDSGNPPGLSIVVVKDGQILYSNAFGYADKPHGVKATPDTVFHWWSMTKIPTAIAIMQLREQGKLNLDNTVTKYLP